jgi:hypothetical protein
MIAVHEAGRMAYPPAVALADPFQALATLSVVARLALQLVTAPGPELAITRLAV